MPDLPPLPPIATEPVSCILLPPYDLDTLDAVVRAWAAFLDTLQREYEILLVGDGTLGERAAVLAGQVPRLRVLHQQSPVGYGSALRTGLAEARHPLLVFSTGDQQYEPADVGVLLKEIDQNHLVCGYRVWQPVPLPVRFVGAIYRGFVRVLLDHPLEPLPGWLGWRGHAWRCLARVLFGLRLHDVACQLFLARRSAFECLPVQSESDMAVLEVLAKANFLGRCMTETPLKHRPRSPHVQGTGAAQRRADFWRLVSAPKFEPPRVTAEAPPVPGPSGELKSEPGA